MASWSAVEGTSSPLGCTWVAADSAYNFAVLSTTATAICVRLFTPTDLVNPVFAQTLDPLVNKSENTWHCRISAAASSDAKYYRNASPRSPAARCGTALHISRPEMKLRMINKTGIGGPFPQNGRMAVLFIWGPRESVSPFGYKPKTCHCHGSIQRRSTLPSWQRELGIPNTR
jgi:hypothetical protein